MHPRLLLLLLALALLTACRVAGPVPTPEADPPAAEEEAALVIPLAGPCADRAAEISGLAWFGDDLVLLPQYPGRFSPTSDSVYAEGERRTDGAVFVLPEADLVAFVKGRHQGPLRPRAVPFSDAGVAALAAGFEGYEAIGFWANRVYLAVEAEGTESMQGFLVEGITALNDEGGLAEVRIVANTLAPLPAQTRIANLAYETLLVTERGVIALQEANGATVNPTPEAYLYDPALRIRDSLDVPTLEYRLTDATSVDAEGRFWGINYFYPGDYGTLRPGPDSLDLVFGEGPTHQRAAGVERLVEFRLDGDRIERTDRPPIQLRLLGHGHARNWEGIARLGDLGFLVATDKYPETILAFVPMPE